jgi:hypothetical protein
MFVLHTILPYAPQRDCSDAHRATCRIRASNIFFAQLGPDRVRLHDAEAQSRREQNCTLRTAFSSAGSEVDASALRLCVKRVSNPRGGGIGQPCHRRNVGAILQSPGFPGFFPAARRLGVKISTFMRILLCLGVCIVAIAAFGKSAPNDRIVFTAAGDYGTSTEAAATLDLIGSRCAIPRPLVSAHQAARAWARVSHAPDRRLRVRVCRRRTRRWIRTRSRKLTAIVGTAGQPMYELSNRDPEVGYFVRWMGAEAARNGLLRVG